MTRLFGTDGVRGVANIEPMSPETVMALGRAAVTVLAAEGVSPPCFVVGRDTRLSGPLIEAALRAGLCSAGANVLDVGIIPTAGVAYLTREAGATAGIMISASHNPYLDNGVKFFSAAGEKLTDPLEEVIETYVRTPAPCRVPITGQAIGRWLVHPDPLQRYSDFLKATFCHTSAQTLRLGLDCANGAVSEIAPRLFRQLGAEVYVWHNVPDGCNINDQCGSQYPEFLQRQVVDNRLDMGFAFDGDGDRLIAVDHTGQVLDGNYVLAICAQDFITRRAFVSPVVVSTVMANLGLTRSLQSMGLRLDKTPVGDKHVLQGMRQANAILGGEPSGHIIFLHHHPTGDGLLTAVQLLNVVLTSQASLADLAQVLQKFPQVLINVKLRKRLEPLSIPAVQEAVQVAEDALGDDGRVVVRLSGTEPVARVMVEGLQHARVVALAEQIARALRRALGES